MFTPPPSGRAHPQRALSVARSLIEECRGKDYRTSKLRNVLTAAVGRAIADAFETVQEEVGSWVGFVWDHEKRRLLPSFGAFPAASWAARFRAGSGVAGHAFRHSRAVAWARKNQDSLGSTIYQERTEQGDVHSVEYQWLLAIPLVVDLDGPSIGVISFARDKADSVFDKKIRALAEAGNDLGERDDWRKLRSKVLAAFWFTLARFPGLADNDYAAECLAATTEVSPRRPAERPPTAGA